MHARVLAGYAQPGKRDELIQIIRDSLVPVAKQQQGFKRYLALTDPSTNKGLTISLWETEADLRAGEASGYVREQLVKVAHVLASAPIQAVYEVSIQEVQQGGPGGHARVLTATVHPGKTDEGVQIVRDSVLPVTRQQPGFKGELLLTDHSQNKVIAITLWETEADLLTGETSGYLQEQLGKVAHLLATQAVREAYEVAFQV